MAKIKDLPKYERPREKALRYGIDKLSDDEILALLIGSGCKDYNAIDIAHDLLKDSRGLFYLFNKSWQEFMNYKGIGKTAGLRIAACFEISKRFKNKSNEPIEVVNDSTQLAESYFINLCELNQEVIILVVLNRKNNIVHEEYLYKGTKENVGFSYFDIIRNVLLYQGNKFYLLHNHPSGDYLPSYVDMMLTNELIQNCKKLKLCLVDHIIISSSGCYSLKNNSILFSNN